MKRFLKKYSRECRAGMLLVMVYSLHLFAVHSLLSDPDDSLSTHSFNDHQSNSDEGTDCFLLLAKKIGIKQTISVSDHLFFVPFRLNETLYSLPVADALTGAPPRLLSNGSYKLYRLLRVFLL